MARRALATKPTAAAELAVVGHVSPRLEPGRSMTPPHALAALAALGQQSRLEIFRVLIRREPDGIAAGQLAEAVGSPHNTTSSNLAILARAGLIYGTREGRSIVYRANVDGISALINFLLTDCCSGHPEVCQPLAKLLSQPRGTKRNNAEGCCDEGC